MKQLTPLTALIALCLCAGCGQMPFGKSAAPSSVTATTSSANPVHAADQTGQNPTGGVSYAMDEQHCSGIAKSRLSLYDKPGPYGQSPQEKQDAYLSLYSSCMRGRDWQVAGPVHGASAPVNVAVNDAAQFANLSPAAGGPPHAVPVNPPTAAPVAVNAAGAAVSTSSVPGATVIVIGGTKSAGLNPAQLSSLSPAAGASSSSPPSVVVVQAQPNGAVAGPANYAMPAANNPYAAKALPVAVPVPPLATAYAAQPHATIAAPSAPVQSAQLHATLHKHLKKPSPAPHPSLATAESDLASDSPQAAQKLADRQLQNVLEK